ncbi:uncharacterized protein KD926_005881 [Aspergillus affinis]|uniref:uncharacterized protein n=1 Tax=Aspergillus affinis TaxID=1070780 RepID=UPI0022FEF5E5|nr:uncharacterized protein KD926_005881 [Aspergillus affinis]KAI9045937.1 hypothetical protein KD926_005881 [Aspergillus affinis]
MLSLGRDPIGPVPATDRFEVAKGAYVIVDAENAQLTTQLQLPSHSLARGLAPGSVFPLDGTPVVSVEEYIATTWARYTTASIGMTGYGYSASNPSSYDRFQLDAKGIEKRVRKYLEDLNGGNARMAGWRQL